MREETDILYTNRQDGRKRSTYGRESGIRTECGNRAADRRKLPGSGGVAELPKGTGGVGGQCEKNF